MTERPRLTSNLASQSIVNFSSTVARARPPLPRSRTSLGRSYTCVGLSLLETFFHEGPSAPPGHSGEGTHGLKWELLYGAWASAGAQCLESFSREATQQLLSQHSSASTEVADEQRWVSPGCCPALVARRPDPARPPAEAGVE